MAGFTREVARRVFAEELRNSNLSFRDGDDLNQYAPQYLLTPTGARCNRIFMVGTLTERDDIGGDTEYWRGRIIDPTGSILIYAGQYQPDAAQTLANIEPPAFVAVVGKPNLFQTEDGSVIISIRAESVQKVDEATRNQWIVETARRTYERLDSLSHITPASPKFSTADKPIAFSSSMDAEKAMAHYKTDVRQYKQMVYRAVSSLRTTISDETIVTPSGKETTITLKESEPEPLKNKPESNKKLKSKSSKGALFEDWAEIESNEDVETFHLGKKN
jgi:RPA family protein